ncbi:AbrB/MazE/SpoVT family DNA-binding domain-containing protein [Psychrilyobacter sp.]|uniref:AbrB/MazE/SpoVT family DNA-binding domain-containing protein n=1 Tax=Psychrilyobacter sp. TaxID=2586924 RepID=UPI003015AD3D
MEKRTLKMMFSKSGSGSITTRLAIPKAWCNKMNIVEEDREIDVYFDEDKKEIVIKKK